LPNAYVLRLVSAHSSCREGRQTQGLGARFTGYVSDEPIAKFCKDTGDFYAGSWHPFAAWRVWDLGRLMAGHRSGDLLDTVDVIEAAVVQRTDCTGA